MPVKLIQPFPGWRPRLGLAQRVAAPPYDILSSTEARRLVQGNPDSFLHVSKAEINLDPDINPYDDRVYQAAKARFLAMQQGQEGVPTSKKLQQDPAPFLYIYRLVMGQSVQVGVVAAASVEAYHQNRIRKHELTRPDKEQDRTQLAETLSAHTGPVFMTYRQSHEIDALVDQIQQTTKPEETFEAEDGVHHSLWVVKEPSLIHGLVDHFEKQSHLYIADGHHRSAAAARVYANKPTADRFLSVLFPDNQVNILDYNRVVQDLNGRTPQAFLHELGQRFHVTASPDAVRPDQRHCFGLYLDNRWYRLALLDTHSIDESNPVTRLDVSLLSQHLLQPLLGITDLRRDKRIDFVGGIRGVEGLMERVDSGEMAAAFSLFPTQLAELMAVADADQIMPPKSTWFEPKLRDGLIIQTF